MATIVAGQTKKLTYGGKMAGREVGHQHSDYPYGVLPCRDGYVSMGAPMTSAMIGQVLAGRAPLLGEHNEEVLGELGYARADLVKLRQRGVL
jgi:crotonobetainyl-CoA:carnitine CoA-transferase CaiB-like acyl-CoA transferase